MDDDASRREADAARSLAKHGLDAALLGRAMTALLGYHERGVAASSGKGDKKKVQLLGDDKLVQVQIGLARVPDRTTPKPIRVQIPHPLHRVAAAKDDGSDSAEEAEVCLIVKEESKSWVKDLVERFPDELGCVKKVLGLQSLRIKHKRYEQRRELLARFDLFLCDDRILPMVGKAIGKGFFEAKKQPVPIKLTRKEALPVAVQRCLSATYMHISAGTCVNIRAGNTGMPVKSLNENVQAIIANAINKIPSKWANVRSVSIKLPDSTSLPVYSKTPEELEEIVRLSGSHRQTMAKEEAANAAEEGDKMKKEEQKRKKRTTAKSPLVRALKKQNIVDSSEESKTFKMEERRKKKQVAADDSGDKSVEKKRKKEDKRKAASKKRQKGESNLKVDYDGDANSAPEKFLPSKKYTGSKKGRVFRNGENGVGYYIDIPPKVDKMAMAALSRLTVTPKKGGMKGTKQSGRKGRRGRR